jgi:hypothetical protein
MALDPSIALGVRLPQIEGPAQQYQNMLALQNAQKQMQQQDMQMQNMLRQRQEMDETRRILAESGGDFGKASNALLQRGFIEPAVRVQQMADLGQQRNAAAQKAQQEMLALKIKNAREFLPAVQDQNSFSAWRQSTIAEVPQLAQFIPEQYSPETVQRLAVGADEMIKRYTVGNTLMDPTGRVVGNAPAAPVRPTGDLALYEAAKAEGYKGTLIDFVREKAAAGRQPVQPPAPIQVTAPDGTVRLYDRAGNVTANLGTVGAQSATFQKNKVAREQLGKDMNQAITELESITKEGGLIDQSTGSGIGKAVDFTAGLFGAAPAGAVAIAKLKPIADLPLKMIPRFEGPQSDKDTQSYKEAAGQLADASLPNKVRKAAGKEILRLMKIRKGQFVTQDMATQGITNDGVVDFGSLK